MSKDLTLKVVFIALGGGAGSVLRFAVSGWVQRLGERLPWLAASVFPIGTLSVNVLGSLALGFLTGVFARPAMIPAEYRFGLTVGLLGGFTTFSTFASESFALTNEREWGLAALNILLNNAGAIAAALIGYRLAARLYGV